MRLIRGKTLLIALIIMGALAASLGIIQIWWSPLELSVFLKSLTSIIVLGTLFSFLIAVDYDLPGSQGKFFLWGLVTLAIIACGLMLAQMWWAPFTAGMFTKLTVTIVILAALLSFVIAVKEDFGSHKKMKDDNYID